MNEYAMSLGEAWIYLFPVISLSRLYDSKDHKMIVWKHFDIKK